MIVQVVFKDPEALDAWVAGTASSLGKKDDMQSAKDHIRKKWMRFGEYLVIEFDTELGTARVLENRA
jgi:hypothetical protein